MHPCVGCDRDATRQRDLAMSFLSSFHLTYRRRRRRRRPSFSEDLAVSLLLLPSPLRGINDAAPPSKSGDPERARESTDGGHGDGDDGGEVGGLIQRGEGRRVTTETLLIGCADHIRRSSQSDIRTQ